MANFHQNGMPTFTRLVEGARPDVQSETAQQGICFARF